MDYYSAFDMEIPDSDADNGASRSARLSVPALLRRLDSPYFCSVSLSKFPHFRTVFCYFVPVLHKNAQVIYNTTSIADCMIYR